MAEADTMRSWVVVLATLHVVAAVLAFAAVAGDSAAAGRGVDWPGSAASTVYAILTIVAAAGWFGAAARRTTRARTWRRAGPRASSAATPVAVE